MSDVDERQPGTVGREGPLGDEGPAGCPRPDLVCDRNMLYVDGTYRWTCTVCADTWHLQRGQWIHDGLLIARGWS